MMSALDDACSVDAADEEATAMQRQSMVTRLWAIAASALVIAACSGGSGSAPQETGPVTLQVMNFANYMPEDIAERFKAATGHDIEVTLTSSNEDAIAKLDASPAGTYDIVFITNPFAEGLNKAGKLEQLDHTKIPNLANLYPEATQIATDPGNKFSVPYSWGTTGICYRKDLVGDAVIDSWNDLLEPGPELAGKITMMDEDRWLMIPALKVLGYSGNSTNEAELQQAADLLIKAKQTLLGYDAETFYTKLDSGEAVAVHGWDGGCNYVTDPSTMGWALPTEGSDLFVDTMAIPKGSPRVEAAHQFIDFILQPENGQWVAENILYKVPNKAAMDALDPSLLETYPNMAITPAELLKQESLRDLGDGQVTFTEAATQVKAAN
jgi:spermidine/putrescine transport system substrate-binding protein